MSADDGLPRVEELPSDKELKEFLGSDAALVMHWAPWCGPCRMGLPAFQDLSRYTDVASVRFVTVNVDEATDEGIRKRIQCIPAYEAWKNGEIVDNSLIGAQSSNQLLQFVRDRQLV